MSKGLASSWVNEGNGTLSKLAIDDSPDLHAFSIGVVDKALLGSKIGFVVTVGSEGVAASNLHSCDVVIGDSTGTSVVFTSAPSGATFQLWELGSFLLIESKFSHIDALAFAVLDVVVYLIDAFELSSPESLFLPVSSSPFWASDQISLFTLSISDDNMDVVGS